MSELQTFYLLNVETEKVVEYGGLPWATPYEDLAWFVRYGLKHNEGIETIVMEYMRTSPPEDLVVAWQLQPHWKHSKLGYPSSAPDSTIGNWGCVVCSLAMMIQTIRGEFVTPVEVNEKLVKVKGFGGRSDNLVIWSKVPLAYPEVKFISFERFPVTPAPVAEYRHWLINGGFVIPQVDIRPATEKVDGHYLFLTDISEDLQIGTGADPWTDRIVDVPPAYVNPNWKPNNFARSIFAAALFERA